MKLGVIDVGTSSIHLLIAARRPGGRWTTLRKERALTRLGDEGLRSGLLTRQAMARAVTVLRRHAATLKRYRVDRVEAVATSAVREASNGAAFVRRVRRELGIPLRVISGSEEARLSYRGVIQGPFARQPVVLVTIGGGSAQVVCGAGPRIRYARSVRLGAARLAHQHIHHDPPLPSEVAALDRHVRRVWAPVIRALRRQRWHRAIGCSAAMDQLMAAAFAIAHPGRALPRRLSVTQGALRRVVARLAQSTAAQRRRLPGIDPQREDLALPAALTLLSWMELCGVQRLAHVTGSLREGLLGVGPTTSRPRQWRGRTSA